MPSHAVSPLPDRPSLEFLKDQSKRLLKLARAQDPAALETILARHPAFRNPAALNPAALALHDAQLTVARLHGFTSWSRLKEEVEARNHAFLSRDERLVKAVRRRRLEDIQTELAGAHAFSAATARLLREALAGIADRSVWHRPHYRVIARQLIAAGVECDIWTAARMGLLEHVQHHLAADPALLHARDSQGRTPLQRAALIYGSDPECEALCAWLFQQGAPVDIFTASAYSLVETVHAELRRDPSLVHQKCQGSTPLNWAVRPRHSHPDAPDLRACELLLAHGADVETVDDQENGMRPLHHLGEWFGREETAALLLARGADLHAKDDIGWTPLDYAINRNRQPMAEFFKRHGATQTLVDWPDTTDGQRALLIASVKRDDLPSVERLLRETPALASVRDEGGDTALHWAAHDGHYEIAALLLRHGADVAAQETRYWGGTPLHWAAERQPLLVELLLAHGADINVRNHRTGQTPLHYCARCDDVPEVAELLLARGADPLLADNRGHTPLDYALKNKHPLVARALGHRPTATS